MVEIARPRLIIKDPQITVHRVPTLSAMRSIRMPPKPEPSQARALANAGIERTPSTSAAMSLSATAVIHAAPNAISIVTSATVATAQDALVSIEEGGDCSIMKFRRPPFWQPAQNLTTHIDVGLLCLLHCAKLRAKGLRGNFLLDRAPTTKLTGGPCGIALSSIRRFASCGASLYEWDWRPRTPRDKAIHAASTGQPRG